MIVYDTDDGVLTFTAEVSDAGTRADAAIAAAACDAGLTLTRSAVQKLIASGKVVCGVTPILKSCRLCGGETFTVTLPETVECDVEPEDIPLDVVYEDEDIIVINKPQGMVVHPAPGHTNGTLVSALLWHCGDSLSGIGGVMRPGIVHRIDRDTSGLICAAKNDAAHLSLAEQLREHSMRRTYMALCAGRLAERRGRVEAPIGRSRTDRKRMSIRPDGKYAATDYEVLEEYGYPGGSASLVRLVLETGRTHQIRVHMAYIGHALLGDTVYGSETQFERRHPTCFAGQSLHAAELRLRHPSSGENMLFRAEAPENFMHAVEILRSTTEN